MGRNGIRSFLLNAAWVDMSSKQTLPARLGAAGIAAFLMIWPNQVGAQQLRIGPTDVGGVVTSAKGPEAGVWVIAETTGLGTKRYAKIVVTDDQGRYLLPALPPGTQYKRDEYVEPNAPVDPTKDKRFNLGFYGISVNPNDGSVWGSSTSGRGWIVRVELGPNPPVTALTEAYQLPPSEIGIRGMDLDSKGIAWAAGAGGNLISFDRSKCRIRNGPTATGDHCPEGFKFYPLPGPKFDGVQEALGTVASPYYVWVDMHDIFGLGKDAVIVLDNQSDGVQAFANGKWVHLAVPYPMGFFTKGMEGRIDDPNGGWSAKGLWATWGGRAPLHSEGGMGTTPYAAQFQLRPNPLANAN